MTILELPPKINLGTFTPPIIVFTLIFYTYFVFVYLVCVQLYEDDYLYTPSLFLIIYHISLFLLIISYIRAIFTNNKVPDDFEHDENQQFDESSLFYSNGKKIISHTARLSHDRNEDGELRNCLRCELNIQKPKPDRTHHCSWCSQCTLRMDHHCPWVANCVGFKNHKFFVLFLLYLSFMCIYGTIVIPICAYLKWDFEDGWDIGRFQILFTFILAAALGLSMSVFSLTHIKFVLTNVTTLEYMDKKRKDLPITSSYDVGTINNIKQLFGSNPLIWLLPIRSSTLSDGTYYPVCSEKLNIISSVGNFDTLFNSDNHNDIDEDSDNKIINLV